MRRHLKLIFIFIGGIFLYLNSASAQQKTNNYSEMAAEILKLVNEHRATLKLSPLKMNEMIVIAASKHSQNMATDVIPFGHDGFDERMEELSKKLRNTNSWAENVAMGGRTAKEAVTMWLNSPVHKENIEGDYNQTGIGIVKSKKGSLYYTQIFCKTGR